MNKVSNDVEGMIILLQRGTVRSFGDICNKRNSYRSATKYSSLLPLCE